MNSGKRTRMEKNVNRQLTVVFLAAALLSSSVMATVACAEEKEITQLNEVVVKGYQVKEQATYKPDVEGAKIYAGKKTTSASLSSQPQIQNNSYR